MYDTRHTRRRWRCRWVADTSLDSQRLGFDSLLGHLSFSYTTVLKENNIFGLFRTRDPRKQVVVESKAIVSFEDSYSLPSPSQMTYHPGPSTRTSQ